MIADQEQNPPARARVVMSRLIHRDQQDRSFDLEFWDRVGAAGRFEAAWQMLKEVQLIRGQSAELPRMQRNVTRVLRRSQMKRDEQNDACTKQFARDMNVVVQIQPQQT